MTGNLKTETHKYINLKGNRGYVEPDCPWSKISSVVKKVHLHKVYVKRDLRSSRNATITHLKRLVKEEMTLLQTNTQIRLLVRKKRLETPIFIPTIEGMGQKKKVSLKLEVKRFSEPIFGPPVREEDLHESLEDIKGDPLDLVRRQEPQKREFREWTWDFFCI